MTRKCFSSLSFFKPIVWIDIHKKHVRQSSKISQRKSDACVTLMWDLGMCDAYVTLMWDLGMCDVYVTLIDYFKNK